MSERFPTAPEDEGLLERPADPAYPRLGTEVDVATHDAFADRLILITKLQADPMPGIGEVETLALVSHVRLAALPRGRPSHPRLFGTVA